MTGESLPQIPRIFNNVKTWIQHSSPRVLLAEKFQLSIFLNVHPFALREETPYRHE